MKINTQNYNEVAIVELQGEFISDHIKAFQDTVQRLIDEKMTGIVLDMKEVTFIDSQCLEQLLWLRDHCNENNSQLKLAGLAETCEKILEITRLQLELDIYDELAEAVKSFV